jgi:predicted nucleic acid-binding protein
MKLVDTSVLVAAALEAHARFDASNRLLERQSPRTCAVTSHALAETYSALTRMPAGFRLTPSEASAFIANWAGGLFIVSLTPAQVVALIAEAPDRGVSGGRIYDALHARTAALIEAGAIVTWNAKHFSGLESGLKVETP